MNPGKGICLPDVVTILTAVVEDEAVVCIDL